MKFGFPTVSGKLKILGFFAQNQQISYADHDSEGIIRRIIILPGN